MNNEVLVDEKPKVFKRVIAFFIDILVVSLLAGIISSTFIDTKKYEEVTKEMSEIITKYSEEEIALEEFQARSRDLNYEMVASSINITIVTLVITIVYYVIMPYFCHGITLGKYLMKIRMISNNDSELNIINYALRSLIINSVLSNISTIIMFYTLSKSEYMNIETKVSGILSLVMIASLISIMYRKDGRGLHDLIANTKVVNINYQKDDCKEQIQDAKIVNEKRK